MSDRPTLVLFPGLGANERFWDRQRGIPADIVVPRWIKPERRETLVHYCERMAEFVPRGVDRLYVGGSSFGGMVALEVARLVSPSALLLIASCYRAAECRGLWMAPIAPWIPKFVFGLMPLIPVPPGALGKVPPELMQWAPGAIRQWNFEGHLSCPVHHIHGEYDWMMPLRRLSRRPDTIIRGGHLIHLLQAEEINTFLTRHVTTSPG
ncbi:MAG TPA: alpha/beta hydrolase [Tepidisphaeraceae bacterium]|nr:alpha/beta hydrolase [Tepidisphaeraceae bacterium]